MKGYFQTTLTGNRATPQNAFIGSIPSINEPYSSMYMPEPSLAYVVPNHEILTLSSIKNYIIITFYLKKEFLKCIWQK
jgi:hypothetical protein